MVWRTTLPSGGLFELRGFIHPHQMRRDGQHHRSLVFPAMNFRNRRVGLNFRPYGGMHHADIEPEIGAQILRQGVQNSTVAAVTVDDGEIARR